MEVSEQLDETNTFIYEEFPETFEELSFEDEEIQMILDTYLKSNKKIIKHKKYKKSKNPLN